MKLNQLARSTNAKRKLHYKSFSTYSVVSGHETRHIIVLKLKKPITVKGSVGFNQTSDTIKVTSDLPNTVHIDKKKKTVFGPFVLDVSKPKPEKNRNSEIWMTDMRFTDHIKRMQAELRSRITFKP